MKTLVELYDSFEAAQETVHALEAAGFDRGDISVVAHSDVMVHGRGEGSATATGVAIGAGVGLAASLAIALVPGIGWVAALGPILFCGAMGAVVGGLVVSLMDAGVSPSVAELFAEGIRRGGTLVTIEVSDEEADRASEIMERHGPVDLIAKQAEWRQAGWTAPSDSAAPSASPASSQTPVSRQSVVDVPAPAMAPNVAIAAPGVQPTRQDATDEVIVVEVTGDAPPDTHIAHAEVDEEFHDDFDRNFPGDYQWDQTRPAYWFGYRAAWKSGGADWNAMEPRLREKWETEHPGQWRRIKDAAQFGFDRGKQPA